LAVTSWERISRRLEAERLHIAPSWRFCQRGERTILCSRGSRAIPTDTAILLHTFLAICLGALVGLERQVAQEESAGEKDFPGVRTFAFVALGGALAVLGARELGPWMGVSLFLAITVFLVLRYFYDASQRQDPGYTTEMASVCTFAVGVLAQSEKLLIATVITIVMVALLRSKRVLHRTAELLSPGDMEALIRFLVIIIVVWPLLPDQPIDPDGPLSVLRPRDVWRMVALISAVSFAGYVVTRLRASQSGYLVMGLLGGMVSSTAATFAYARAERSSADSRSLEFLVLLAVATSFLRVGVVLAVIGPVLLFRSPVWFALLGMSVVTFLAALVRHRPTNERTPIHGFDNPLTLRFALTFAAAYALVLVLVAAAQDYTGLSGIYATTAIAALVGADAPSLSLTRLAVDGVLTLETASSGVIVVAIAATVGKIGILATLARTPFALRVGTTLLVTCAAGGAFLYTSLR
jgi:uncharacterized membrane protein (DUF4010 family)